MTVDRGKAITADSMRGFIKGLNLPEDDRQRLLAMTPASYTGLAAELAKRLAAGR